MFGFFKRTTSRTGGKEAPLSVFVLNGGRYSAVVGESHYQEALNRTAKLARKEPDEEGEERLYFEAVLVREPTNEYDARAVAVHSPAGKVAYAPRGSEWCALLDSLAQRGYDKVTCHANLTGGGPDKSWGVVLHAHPEHELRLLRDR